MSKLAVGIFAAVALCLSLGAVQLALSHDLSAASQSMPGTPVNRVAKADRADAALTLGSPTRTISLQLNDISATSVLVRIPIAEAVPDGAAAPRLRQPGRPTVACEPVVSVLTEVSKRLPPGRCVT